MHVFLETERLILRRFTENDADALFELYDDPAVMKYLNGGQPADRTEIVTSGKGKVRSYGLDGKLLWEFGGMSSNSKVEGSSPTPNPVRLLTFGAFIRCVLVTLNASTRSCNLWFSFHGKLKDLVIPMSRLT